MPRLISSLLVLSLCAAVFAACSSSETAGAATPGGTGGATAESSSSTGSPVNTEPPILEDLQGRDYQVKVPQSYDSATPVPLVVMLHQLWKTEDAREAMDEYLHISPEAEARGMIVAMPFGTFQPSVGQYGWNAMASCCGFDTPDLNDVGYIMAMVNQIRTKYRIDDKRIFLIGQSNGSFLAHRLACDRASVFAGLVTLTGATFKDPDDCFAGAPVAVLHYHGDQDPLVPFAGGAPFGVTSLPPVPSAEDTARISAEKNRCNPSPDRGQPALDLVPTLDGAETERVVYQGCEANGATELQIVHGGKHTPLFDGALWAKQSFDFLMAHPKP